MENTYEAACIYINSKGLAAISFSSLFINKKKKTKSDIEVIVSQVSWIILIFDCEYYKLI
jgi:hypothetical protein